MDERDRQVEAALHAARVGRDTPVEGVADVDELGQLAEAARGGRAAQAVKARLQAQQLAAGLFRVNRGGLQSGADREAHLLGLVHHVEAGDARAASRGHEQRAEHPHHRRLAGTVRPEEAVDLAARDRQVDAVDGAQVAEGAGQALGLDREVGVTHRSGH